MGTNFTYKGRNVSPKCLISQADTFPCFEFLDNNVPDGYNVDLICSDSHFVRMNVELDGKGKTVLTEKADGGTISGFVQEQKLNWSKMPDADKELFEHFVGFTSIKHPYGAAVSMRALMENFFKDNFLVQAMNNHMTEDQRDKLFHKSHENDYQVLAYYLDKVNFTTLLKIMKTNKRSKNGGHRAELENAVLSYITKDTEGISKKLSEQECEDVIYMYRFFSSVIHGNHYDSTQIFKVSMKFFDLLTVYFQQKNLKWSD